MNIDECRFCLGTQIARSGSGMKYCIECNATWSDEGVFGMSIIQDPSMAKDEIIILVSPKKYYRIHSLLSRFSNEGASNE